MALGIKISMERQIDSEILHKLSRTAQTEVNRFLNREAKALAADMKERAPKSSMRLSKSIKVRKLDIGSEILVEAPYAATVEFGAGPIAGRPTFRPPIQGLLPWVRREWGLSGRDAMRAAYALQTRIYRFGIRKQPFFNPSIDAWEPGFRRRLTGLMEQMVQKSRTVSNEEKRQFFSSDNE